LLLTSERRDLYLPLDELEIPIDARAKLEALGITTVEELRAYWYYENRELLTEYLGDSPLNLVAMKPTAGAMRGMAAKGPGGSVLATGPVPPPRPMPRGVLLPPSQRLRRAAAPSMPPATRRGEDGGQDGRLDDQSVPDPAQPGEPGNVRGLRLGRLPRR
jgi:hypothetical protein